MLEKFLDEDGKILLSKFNEVVRRFNTFFYHGSLENCFVVLKDLNKFYLGISHYFDEHVCKPEEQEDIARYGKIEINDVFEECRNKTDEIREPYKSQRRVSAKSGGDSAASRKKEAEAEAFYQQHQLELEENKGRAHEAVNVFIDFIKEAKRLAEEKGSKKKEKNS